MSRAKSLVALIGALSLLLIADVYGDGCKDNLDRCARVRPQSQSFYEISDKPVHRWVADMLLIDPSDASTICRDWPFYVSTLTCMRNRIREHVCWSQSKYYGTDRYIPEEKTLKKAMEVFCDTNKRQEKINMNNCMLLNARENRLKEECLREEEEKSMRRFGHSVNDNSMCSFFHKRMNCYRIYFGAICKTTLQENTAVYNAITMDEYFDPLRKASICHIIEGASTASVAASLLVASLVLQWFL